MTAADRYTQTIALISALAASHTSTITSRNVNLLSLKLQMRSSLVTRIVFNGVIAQLYSRLMLKQVSSRDTESEVLTRPISCRNCPRNNKCGGCAEVSLLVISLFLCWTLKCRVMLPHIGGSLKDA